MMAAGAVNAVWGLEFRQVRVSDDTFFYLHYIVTTCLACWLDDDDIDSDLK